MIKSIWGSTTILAVLSLIVGFSIASVGPAEASSNQASSKSVLVGVRILFENSKTTVVSSNVVAAGLTSSRLSMPLAGRAASVGRKNRVALRTSLKVGAATAQIVKSAVDKDSGLLLNLARSNGWSVTQTVNYCNRNLVCKSIIHIQQRTLISKAKAAFVKMLKQLVPAHQRGFGAASFKCSRYIKRSPNTVANLEMQRVAKGICG